MAEVNGIWIFEMCAAKVGFSGNGFSIQFFMECVSGSDKLIRRKSSYIANAKASARFLKTISIDPIGTDIPVTVYISSENY